MGLRLFTPDGTVTEVLRFRQQTGPAAWCWCNVHTLQHNLVYGKRPVALKPAKGAGPYLVAQLSGTLLTTLAATGHTTLRHFADRIKKEKSVRLSTHDLLMDVAMQQCVFSIVHGNGSPQGRGMFLYARVLDLLWLQQENFARAQQPHPVYVKTEYDRERIVFARDYLLTHMDAPPTLVQLAAIAGINEFKLKRGFREMFNQSVFAYLAEVRLDMARRALREKQKPVTQIAFELGYASLQHFSAAFKKKFGVSPLTFAGSRPVAAPSVKT